MNKVAMNIGGLSVSDEIAKGRTTLTAAGDTDGVAVLGTPAPAEVTALLAATDTLEAAHSDREVKISAAEGATQTLANAEALWQKAFGAYARMGDTKAGGDITKIKAIGLDVAGSTHGPSANVTGGLPQPTGMHITDGDARGELN